MLVWDTAVPHRSWPLQQQAAAFPERGATTYHGRVQSFHLLCTPVEGASPESSSDRGTGAADGKKAWRPSVQALLAVRRN